MSITEILLALTLLQLFFIGHDILKIERNTRPPKPDIKSFITKNTKGNHP